MLNRLFKLFQPSSASLKNPPDLGANLEALYKYQKKLLASYQNYDLHQYAQMASIGAGVISCTATLFMKIALQHCIYLETYYGSIYENLAGETADWHYFNNEHLEERKLYNCDEHEMNYYYLTITNYVCLTMFVASSLPAMYKYLKTSPYKLLRDKIRTSINALLDQANMLPNDKKEKLIEDLNSEGCDLFLMLCPNDNNYIKSDKNHLFLYKKSNNKIFYYIEGEDRKEYLGDKEQLLLQEQKAEFNSFPDKLIKYNNTGVTKAILDFTSKQGHTQDRNFVGRDAYYYLSFDFICPITQSYITQPYEIIVKAKDGTKKSEVYEAASILTWLKDKNISPISRDPIIRHGFSDEVNRTHKNYWVAVEAKITELLKPEVSLRRT